MILIISHNSLDYPTEQVFNWVKYLGHDCQRFNGSELLKSLNFNINFNSDSYTFESDKLNLSEVSAIWIRRWIDNEEYKHADLSPQQYGKEDTYDVDEITVQKLSQTINVHVKSEFRGLSHYFFDLIEKKPKLGDIFYAGTEPSKIKQLLIARQVGLSVPNTVITDSKKVLLDFLEANNNDVICKNISEIGVFEFKISHVSYTTKLSTTFVEKLPLTFFPSLFQKKIEKEIEIRTFYLNGKMYSMAIFSSGDKQTETDYRVYNEEKPNRTIPFQLPSFIEVKIIELMKYLKLDTGSIDLILSKDGEYYFLEVNPRGQFSMVSIACNYHLEKKVAEYLINLSTND